MHRNPKLSRPFAALTITGSDAGGIGGIAGDLRTFAAHGLMGCSAVTAVTVEGTVGILKAVPLDAALVAEQIDVVVDRLPVRAVKTGLLVDASITGAVADALERHPRLPVVLDPRCVPTTASGTTLLDEAGLRILRERLLPRATVITPSLDEAALVAGLGGGASFESAEQAAEALAELAGPRTLIVIRGGHGAEDARSGHLLRRPNGQVEWLDAARVSAPLCAGGTCAFSAAIASQIALGEPPVDAIRSAKRYVTGALLHARPTPGTGAHSVDHLWHLRVAAEL